MVWPLKGLVTMKLTLLLAAGALALAAAGASSAAVVVADHSFEAPSVPGGYEYGAQNGAQHSSNNVNATAPGVTFNGGSGVQANGSAWGFAAAPDGVQTAFLQSYDNATPGSITMDLSGLVVGESYDVSFLDANRAGYGVNPVTVSYVGGGSLGTFTPLSDSFGAVTSGRFTATATTGDINFSVASNAGDSDIGIDNVSVSAVPEPAIWAMMLLGFFGLGAMVRVARREPPLLVAG